MIIFDRLTKTVGSKKVLSSVSIQIPTDRRIALVGGEEADKQIVLEILAGTAMPTVGRINRAAHVSFPVGRLPGFSSDLTVRLNVAHVARLYGANIRQTVRIVEKALRIGPVFDKPYAEVPKNMRRPLAQIVAFTLPFDAYILLDDKFRPPPKERPEGEQIDHPTVCFEMFRRRLRTSGMIIPTQNVNFAQEYCELGLVLRDGRLELFEDIGEAFDRLSR